MKFAIIAAGEGSRLAAEGIGQPKPLVEVCGEKLIDRLLRVFVDCGATEVVVICNNLSPLVENHLNGRLLRCADGSIVPLRLVVKTTPSSMHSFFELSDHLTDGPFVLTTVDTIFREDEFRHYVGVFSEAVRSAAWDGVMGVTGFVDDEKPLYVGVSSEPVPVADETGQPVAPVLPSVTGFFDEPGHGPFVSGGIYGLTPVCLETLRRAVARGEHRMRNFQRALIADGRRLGAFRFSKVLDIDHAHDVAVAEDFLRETKGEPKP